MKIIFRSRFAIAMLLLFGICAAPQAQTTAGSGTVIVIPVVSQSSTFATTMIVHNPNASGITVHITFDEAQSSSNPGIHACTDLAVSSGQSKLFLLATQCSLPAGNHHGQVIIQDSATPKINIFYAYSRTQTAAGVGFSVEGYPAGNFSGSGASVLGLARTSTGAKFSSNCFVGSLGEAISYKISLFDGPTNVQIGSDVTGSLGAYQQIRYIDIFTVAGAPAGDYSNVRAKFVSTSGAPAIIGFCTLQESVTFSADFRIAKSQEASDNRQRRLICYGQDSCGTVNAVNPTAIPDASTKYIHSLFIEQPDYVQCTIVSPHAADLQMQVRGPGGDVFLAPVFSTSPPYSSGGAGQTTFYIFTGERNAVNGGTSTRWFIDVGPRTGGTPTFPIAYGITCNSGNGVSVPYYRAQAALDF